MSLNTQDVQRSTILGCYSHNTRRRTTYTQSYRLHTKRISRKSIARTARRGQYRGPHSKRSAVLHTGEYLRSCTLVITRIKQQIVSKASALSLLAIGVLTHPRRLAPVTGRLNVRPDRYVLSRESKSALYIKT